jgi:hypothetical protein
MMKTLLVVAALCGVTMMDAKIHRQAEPAIAATCIDCD